MSAPELASLLRQHPLPDVEGDKHTRGTLVVVGGAERCPGAAILAGISALRVGAGRVQLVVHPAVAATVAAAFPEAYVVGWEHGAGLPESIAEHLGAADAVLVGPGLGDEGGDTARAVAGAVPLDVPLLLDATSTTAAVELAGDASRTLLSAPNETEARSIVGDDDEKLELDELAHQLSAALGSRPVAVRGVQTVVVDGAGGAWVHDADVDGLGTAGSGDVFAGVAAALLARGTDALATLAWSVGIHARAGARAAAAIGPIGFLAREVADELPRSLSDLQA